MYPAGFNGNGCRRRSGAERPVPQHRGSRVQAYGAIQLAADSEYLGELRTGRWVDWAVVWFRGITHFLAVDHYGIPSAELVPFDDMSGAMQIGECNSAQLPGRTVLHTFLSTGCRHW